MEVSAALGEALAARRGHFNARVAATRHGAQGFDAGAFADFLRVQLDPIVVAVAEVAPDRVPAAVAAGYEMALRLIAQKLAGPGARSNVVDRLWSGLAPLYATAIAAEPVVCLGGLSNAGLRLAAIPGVRVDEWLHRMAALAPFAASADIRAFGLIAAWRAGMAHYREGALEAGDRLPDEVAVAAAGGPAGLSWAELKSRLIANRWWSPDVPANSSGVAFGAFTGFGGAFGQPPVVRASPQGFHIRSAERHFLLVADIHGATLHAAEDGAFDGAEHDDDLALRSGSMIARDRGAALDLPSDGLRAIANADTIALTSPYSHAIRLLPRVRP